MLTTFRAIQAEQEQRRAREEQSERDRVQDDRDRRQFHRNAGLALMLALAFNSPGALLKAIWLWLSDHVSLH